MISKKSKPLHWFIYTVISSNQNKYAKQDHSQLSRELWPLYKSLLSEAKWIEQGNSTEKWKVRIGKKRQGGIETVVWVKVRRTATRETTKGGGRIKLFKVGPARYLSSCEMVTHSPLLCCLLLIYTNTRFFFSRKINAFNCDFKAI